MSKLFAVPSRADRQSATADLLAWLIVALRSVELGSVTQCIGSNPSDLLERAGGGRIDAECIPSDSIDLSALVEELETEYVRLFLQNRERDPAYLEALSYLQQQGPAAQTALLERIRGHARRNGVDLEAGSPYPIDHLTILLELIYLDPPEGVAALARHPVWADCVAPWLGEFRTRFRNLGPHPYYRSVLRILDAMHEAAPAGRIDERT